MASTRRSWLRRLSRVLLRVGALACVLAAAAFALSIALESPTGLALAGDQAGARGLRLLEGEAPDALRWNEIGPQQRLPDRLALLVHGLDEPGSIWDDLAPALAKADHTVARFEYPNDQRVRDSADLLLEALRSLRARGVERVDLVAHSMGGLVAREALTRPEQGDREQGSGNRDQGSGNRDQGPGGQDQPPLYAGDARGGEALPHITRLILVGTPNEGSPMAPLQSVSELREAVMRWASSFGDAHALETFDDDGAGEAAIDLAPGSDFLSALNARPLPAQVSITVIAGRVSPMDPEAMERAAARLLGEARARALGDSARQLVESVGDGLVPLDSAILDGVEDVVVVEANHRAMLKRSTIVREAKELAGAEQRPAPAIPVILERLEHSPGADPDERCEP